MCKIKGFAKSLFCVLLRYFYWLTFCFQIFLLCYVPIQHLLVLDPFVNVCSFRCYLALFHILLHSLNLFRVFVIFGIFRGRWITTSVQKIFLVFFFPYYFSWSSMLIPELLVLRVFTSLDSTIESSELLILHVDSLSLVSWVTSKSHVSPTILQFLFWRISLLRSFLIISFFMEISDLRNSISLSRLVISF